MGIKAIIDGHLNELLGLNEDYSKNRLEICKQCPLYKETIAFGPICNNKLWINLETDEISTVKKDGFRRGCGCRLNAKTRNIRSTCPINKW